MNKNVSFLWLCAFLPAVFNAEPQGCPIVVDLLNQEPGDITSKYYAIEDTSCSIDILNIDSNISFFVIQIHSYIENVVLSYNNNLIPNQYTTGTNIGLVWSRNMLQNNISNGHTARFFLIRHKPMNIKLEALLAISTYSKDDPIPGGCNLSFETEIAPYQKITYNDNTITVTSQPPSKDELFCHKNNITTSMYYMYLKEYNKDIEEYLSGLQKMIFVENILKYGKKVPSGLGSSKYKQIYNLYRGTGRVFAVISTMNGRSSAYVPAVSFGCDISMWSENCIGPVGTQWKVMCAFFVILGIFICFAGHRYFKTGLFTVGYTFGSIITLVLIAIDDYVSGEVKIIYSIAVGICFGFFWLLLWWKYGAPLISIQLTILLAGTLIASMFFYNVLGDLIFFSDDLYFWLVFSIIVIIIFMPIFVYPSVYHIIALSLLGSYAFVVAMNYYIGGNLPYILINTYRRIAVKDFGDVVVDPPYQILDFAQTLLWALIFGLGIFVQYRYSKGRAPFPPQRSGATTRSSNNRRTPLRDPETISPTLTTEVVIEHHINDRTPLINPERLPPPPYST